ncbi:TPA: hypothetical protein ACHKIC_004534, partial [Escherichia coli]
QKSTLRQDKTVSHKKKRLIVNKWVKKEADKAKAAHAIARLMTGINWLTRDKMLPFCCFYV